MALEMSDVVSAGMNGGVFISDITPLNTDDNIGNKIFSMDNNVLDSCTTDTLNMKVHVTAFTGNTNYTPKVKVKGVEVNNLTEIDNNGIFTGSINISITELDEKITATHEDGALNSVDIEYIPKPEILEAYFTGGYPGSQTELKENDTFDLYIKSNTEPVEIEIADESAFKGLVTDQVSGKENTIENYIADRGNVAVPRYAKVRVKDLNGSYSNWFFTNSTGSDDGRHLVILNNVRPSITIDSIEYPTNQEAIKNSETAIIKMTVDNYDEFLLEDILGELNILNPNSYSALGNEVERIGGDYNLDNTNFRVTLNRLANDSSITETGIVKIVNTPAEVTVTEQNENLRSSPSGNNNLIIISSNQELIEPPTLSADVGVWVENKFQGGRLNWNRNLKIDDSMTKGTYNWSNLLAKGLSGIITNTIKGEDEYKLAGFKERELTFPAFERKVDIGTNVVDPYKLICTDMSGEEFNYQSSKLNSSWGFTIVDSDGTLNPNGRYIYITDDNWVYKNSEGLAYITIEEI